MIEPTVEQVINIPASITAEDVENFKQKHDCVISQITVEDKTAWFRSPSLKILDAANAQKKSLDYYKVIAKNCIIAGDPDIVNREPYFIALMPKLDQVINPFEAEIKKL